MTNLVRISREPVEKRPGLVRWLMCHLFGHRRWVVLLGHPLREQHVCVRCGVREAA